MEDDIYFSKIEDDLNIFFKWKMTSILSKMEDDLNFFKNARLKLN